VHPSGNASARKNVYEENWHDGWFYANFIERITRAEDRIVKDFVKNDMCVIDIGCVTGSLALSLSGKCKAVTGIDVSPKMIQYAEKRRKKDSVSNVDFILTPKREQFSEIISREYDCCILKLLVHEMHEEERASLIKQAGQISKEIILVDFIAPLPISFHGQRIFVLEFFAGRQHFRNFKKWHEQGGIDGFVKRQGLKIEQEKLSGNGTVKIVRVHE